MTFKSSFSVYYRILEVFQKAFVNFLSSLIPNSVGVIGLLLVDEFNVVFFQSAVLELPCLAMVLLEVLFILVHVFLEYLLPAWLEVNLPCNFIGNVSKVNANLHQIRLLVSMLLALVS